MTQGALENIGEYLTSDMFSLRTGFIEIYIQNLAGCAGIVTDEWRYLSIDWSVTEPLLKRLFAEHCKCRNYEFLDFGMWFAVRVSFHPEWLWEEVKRGKKLHWEADYE